MRRPQSVEKTSASNFRADWITELDVPQKLLTPQQYRWLMEGLKIEQPKAHKAVTGLSMA